MKKVAVFAVVFALSVALGTFVAPQALQAQQQGTAAEAKAMLEKAVVAVKADKAKALAMFNNGEGGFKDRDLYPFCFNIADGKVNATAAKNLIGTDVRTLKDKTGKAFGEEMYKVVKDGTISEVSYMFPRPGTDTTPVQKVSFVTKVGDQGCGVGYYK
jgi:lipopolysaccharide export LptBFGC system permease protein LptF